MLDLLQNSLTIGTLLSNGKYIIEKTVAVGSFALTYRAKDIITDQVVCIKALYKLDTEEDIQRFQNEAKTLNTLSQIKDCPNIVKFIDYFQDEITDNQNNEKIKIYVLVMEFLDGQSLLQYVEQRHGENHPFSQADVDLYFEQIANALHILHQEMLVHRDAHPSNIIIEEQKQRAILIDFGLSGKINPVIPTRDHFASRAFAPPEQKKGDRSFMMDIYTLSASLYYAITKTFPFDGESREKCVVDGGKDPFTLPKSLNKMRPGIRQAIQKGMSIKPDLRPKSITDWLSLFKKETNSLLSVNIFDKLLNKNMSTRKYKL